MFTSATQRGLWIGGDDLDEGGSMAPPGERPYGRRERLRFVAGVFITVGFVGFIGILPVLDGKFDGVLKSIEWPMGWVSNVVTTSEGLCIAPHIPTGRVQVYRADGSFRNGWRVEAGGGVFESDGGTSGLASIFRLG